MIQRGEVEEESIKPSDRRISISKSVFGTLAVINTIAILLIGLFIYNKQSKRMSAIWQIGQDKSNRSQQESQRKRIGQLVPLETFLVNLAGSRGRRLIKLSMELEVEDKESQEEIDHLRPKIRDIIIILISSKSYEEMSNPEGKEKLRNEIRDQVNLFLSKGKIMDVYFTQFIFN